MINAQRFHRLYVTLFNSRPTLVTNSFFNTSLLKPRIQMLVSSPTNQRSLWRYALVLPLLAVLAGLTAAREQLAETLLSQPGRPITVSGRVVDSQNKPVRDVQIYVQKPTGKFTTDQRGAIERTGGTIRTDQEGRYKLTGVSPAAKVEFIHPAYIAVVSPVKTLLMTRRTRLFKMADIQAMRAEINNSEQRLHKNKRTEQHQPQSGPLNVADSRIPPVNEPVSKTEADESTSFLGNYNKDFLYVLDDKPLLGKSTIVQSNRHDIETIEVIPGEAAARVYGVESKTGVVHIRTKATNVQKPEVVEALFGVVRQLDPTETDFKINGSPASNAEVLKLSTDQIRKVVINKDRNGPYGYVTIYTK